MVFMKIEGIDRLETRIGLIVAAAKDADKLEKVLLEGAEEVANSARNKAPLGPTGNLKRGIRATLLSRLNGQPGAGAGANYRIAPHAHLVEYGTSRSAPHPFLRPAIDETKGRVTTIIGEGLRKIIKGAI